MSDPTIKLLALLNGKDGIPLTEAYADENLCYAARMLEEWMQQIEVVSKRLRVVMVGQFNAGKSTIVNALLGRRIAFTDPFEATLGVGLYVPDSVEFVELNRQGGTERISVPEFSELCSRRAIKDVEVAEIHLLTHVPYELVDTPGMSSLNEEHEARAEMALKAADLLLWIIDPVDLMAAQEGAFLRRAKEIGIPIRLLLSKADSVEEDEILLMKDYIQNRLGYQPDDILAVSAESHSNATPDPGISALAAELERLTLHTVSIKEQALAAKQREIGDECERIVVFLLERNGEETAWIRAEAEFIGQQRAAVERQLLCDLDVSVRHAFQEHLQELLPSHIPNDPQEIADRCVNSFADRKLTRVLDKFLVTVRDQAETVWSQQFAVRSDDLQNQIRELMKDGIRDEGTIGFLNDQLMDLAKRRDAIHATFAVQGKGSEGPLSPEVIAVAVGGVAALLAHTVFPLVGGAIAAWYFNSKRPRREDHHVPFASPEVQALREELIREFSNEIASAATAKVEPLLSAFLERTENEALERICRDRYAGRSPAEIDRTRTTLRDLQTELTEHESHALKFELKRNYRV